jgi:uncharacterized protein
MAAALCTASLSAAQSPTPSPTPSASGDFVPPAPRQHFTDHAAFVSSEAGARLDGKLARFQERSGHRFLVVVFPEMPVLDPPAVSLHDFTLRTANIWAASGKGAGEGVVLFVFVRERKLRLEVSAGLAPRLTNDVTQRIVDDKITPPLRRGDTAGGLEAGIDAVIAFLEPRTTP